MKRSAQVLIDEQRALFEPEPRPHEAVAVLARIRTLAAQARAAGVPVVWVQHEHAGRALAHGGDGRALPTAVQAEPGDRFVRKTTTDAVLRTCPAAAPARCAVPSGQDAAPRRRRRQSAP